MADLTGKLDALYKQITSFFGKKQWEKCIGACTEFLDLAEKGTPTSAASVSAMLKAEIYQRRGHALNEMGSHNSALADFDAAMKLIPENANLYNSRGNVYFKKDEFDRAIADFNKALELDPKLARAYNNRGNAYRRKGEFDRALADLNKALDLGFQPADALNNRGNVYVEKGDFDRAIADYSKALEFDPNLAAAYYGLGNAFRKMGEFGRAIGQYSMALEKEPGNPAFLNNRAVAYSKQGDYDRAISDYDEAIKNDPTNLFAIQNRVLAIAAKEQVKSNEQFQARFDQQQKQFDAQIEARVNEYDINLLRIEEYEARQKKFQNEAKEAREKMQKWLGVLRWIAGGFLVLVLLCMGYTFKEGPEIWPIFPLITAAAGLCAFPFIWQIRALKQEEARLMALSQDAYTKGILANLINVNLGAENRKELLHKFFDHHAEHGSAQLIIDLENNGKSESGAVNVLIKYLKDNMSGKN